MPFPAWRAFDFRSLPCRSLRQNRRCLHHSQRAMTYSAEPQRYDGRMPYRVCGRSGLRLPAISRGLGHNFGDATPMAAQRQMLRTAFDLGITHFDLANNYGPPYGSAQTNFCRLFKDDFKPYRHELLISSKAG